MTRPNRNLELPEPTFPEHQLIQNCAPEPVLSASFKARVMAECTVSMASARNTWRWKVGGTVAAVCALGLMVCLAVPEPSDTSPPLVDQTELLDPGAGHGPAIEFPPSSSHIAVDTVSPPSGGNSEKTQMDQMMDGLKRRQQIFDANMF